MTKASNYTIIWFIWVIGVIIVFGLYSIPLPHTQVRVASADTAGPSGAGTAAAETTTCSDNMNWGVPSTELSANDTTYVSYTGNNFDTGEISDGIYASNYGFSTSGTIDGIQVEIINFSDGKAWEYEDIVLGTAQGTRVGSDKADSTQAAPTSDPGSTTDSWGGTADTWGASLTSAQVNASTFGVEFCWQAGTDNVHPSIDFVQVTITYTASAEEAVVPKQSVIFFD